MEKRWLWFDTSAGCGVGCLAVFLTLAACLAAYSLGAGSLPTILVAAVPAVTVSAWAFRVDRRRARAESSTGR